MTAGQSSSSPFTGKLPDVVAFIREAAVAAGIEVRHLDEEVGHLFQLKRDSRTVNMLGGRSPLNDAMAARLAGDKHYTNVLLDDAGIRTPPTTRCIAPGYFTHEKYEAQSGDGLALAFAAAHGYPLVVKPNRLSHGRGVTLVDDEAELREALKAVWAMDYIALVQEVAGGVDLRLNFLDGSFLAGYVRVPVVIIGDARQSIRALVSGIDARFARDHFWELVDRDPAWRKGVLNRGLSASAVLPAGERLDLGGHVLNLHRFATASMLTTIPPEWTRWGLRVGEVMNLRHFGIDARVPLAEPAEEMSEDPLAAAEPDTAVVIEVNASPLLLEMHRLGARNQAIAAQVRVLEAIFATP